MVEQMKEEHQKEVGKLQFVMELQTKKIKELKEYLRVCGVSIAGVTEKSGECVSGRAEKEGEEPKPEEPPPTSAETSL